MTSNKQLRFDSFPNILNGFLSRLTPQAVGASGLAILCSASILALAPATGHDMMTAAAVYLGNLGLNVLAGVLQNFYQTLLSEPTDDELRQVQRLSILLSREIRNNPKLRGEIGDFLNKQKTLDIAREVIKGNPAASGWLLWRIYEDGNEYKAQLSHMNQSLIEIKGLIEDLSRDSNFPPRISTIQEYFSELKKEASLLVLPGIPGVPDGIQPVFKDIYVSQQLHMQRPQHKGTYAEFLSERRLWVRDTAGSGKSTLLKRILLDQCKYYSENNSSTVVPVVLHAQQLDFKSSKPIIDHLIEIVAQQRGLSRYLQQWLNEAFNQGKMALLIDGLDEIPPDSQLNVSRILRNFSFQQTNNHIFLASRPTENTGITFPKVEIDRFDMHYASFLVRNWKEYFNQQGILDSFNESKLAALENDLNEAFKDSGVVAKILQTPLYLTYLIFNTISPSEDDPRDTNRLIKSKTSLIKRTIEHVIPYWERNKNGRILGQASLPSKTIALKILWFTAFLLKKYPYSSKSDILFSLEGELASFFEGQSSTALERGFNYWQDANVLNVSDIDASVSFWHAEINDLCAAEYINTSHGLKSISSDKEMMQAIQANPYWENVRRFYRSLPKKR